MFDSQLTGSISFTFLQSILLSWKTKELASKGNLPTLLANSAIFRFVEKIINVSYSSIGH